jgi:hypothetical protein
MVFALTKGLSTGFSTYGLDLQQYGGSCFVAPPFEPRTNHEKVGGAAVLV